MCIEMTFRRAECLCEATVLTALVSERVEKGKKPGMLY